jgi:hypothetical protein
MPSAKEKPAGRPAPAQDAERTLAMLVAAVLILVILFVSYSMFTGRTPEGFTQVYLAEERPSQLLQGALSFSFFIDSHETAPADYNYLVIMNGSPAESGLVTVGAGAKQEVIVSFEPSGISYPAKILTEVTKGGTGENYSLWFWIQGEGT